MRGREVLAVAGLGLLLAACQSEQKPLQSGLQGYDPHLLETQRAACEKNGGRFAGGGPGGSFVCYRQTRDAGKSCSNANQCEGLCLAKSRSCAPVRPLFGCNEILTSLGAPATVCVE